MDYQTTWWWNLCWRAPQVATFFPNILKLFYCRLYAQAASDQWAANGGAGGHITMMVKSFQLQLPWHLFWSHLSVSVMRNLAHLKIIVTYGMITMVERKLNKPSKPVCLPPRLLTLPTLRQIVIWSWVTRCNGCIYSLLQYMVCRWQGGRWHS